jgi:GT2 family glycosyltransferase
LWTSITNITIFLKTEIARKVHGYDEKFGLGSGVFEGGEETDFFIKILKNGGKIIFSPQIIIYHKNENYTLSNPIKQWGYEESWGALFNKWFSFDRIGLTILLASLYLIFKTFIRAFYFAIKGNFINSKLYFMKNKARFCGFNKYWALRKTII